MLLEIWVYRLEYFVGNCLHLHVKVNIDVNNMRSSELHVSHGFALLAAVAHGLGRGIRSLCAYLKATTAVARLGKSDSYQAWKHCKLLALVSVSKLFAVSALLLLGPSSHLSHGDDNKDTSAQAPRSQPDSYPGDGLK